MNQKTQFLDTTPGRVVEGFWDRFENSFFYVSITSEL